jgi:hypothetical protein
MVVSPAPQASTINSVYQEQGAQKQAQISKNAAPSEQSTDAVHLSAAATAKSAGGDVDHDGDSH